ncbi:MAG: glucokinase [Anaerolineae bacterium]|nr:glucokinase [Anaerolineae bacterium]
MLLAGDVGGTKTNLAIYASPEELTSPLVERTFSSKDFPCLEDLVRFFLRETGIKVQFAVFGIAGPVLGGRVTGTNLPWVVERERIRTELGLEDVWLLNDLEAVAYALPLLKDQDLYVLNKGEEQPQGTRAIVAPGTGLGEAFAVWVGDHYYAHPSEGGHTDFAPTNLLESELLTYLLKRFPHVSYERVCSGVGIPNLYAFLRDEGYGTEPSWLAEQLAEALDPTPFIINAALERKPPDPLCEKTLELFLSILGAEAGNLALKVLALGGVYLGGGIPPRILPALKKGVFMEAFQNKGRMSSLMQKIPVYVILNAKAALLGVACYGVWKVFGDGGG